MALVLVAGALGLVVAAGAALVLAARMARSSPRIARYLGNPRRVMRTAAVVALVAVAAVTAGVVLAWNR